MSDGKYTRAMKFIMGDDYKEPGHPSPSEGITHDQGETKVVDAVPTGSGCGMCAHWKQTTRFNRPPFGMCMWRPDKCPAWFSTENSTMLFETDGKNCEAFTPNNKLSHDGR